MTAKEKALELANKMYFTHGHIDSGMAIKCALIAVDEIIKSIEPAQFRVWHNEIMCPEFWNEVKTELNKL